MSVRDIIEAAFDHDELNRNEDEIERALEAFEDTFDPTHVALMEAVVETARKTHAECNGYPSIAAIHFKAMCDALDALTAYRNERAL